MLFGQHGLALFDLPMFTEAPKFVMQALQRCHHASEAPPSEAAGKVKVQDQKAPGGTMQVVLAYMFCTVFWHYGAF